ncbi:hypothetical protein [Streptomyces sp. XY431]|nr:hypothetical protein [Streptomyces sp. XY431]
MSNVNCVTCITYSEVLDLAKVEDARSREAKPIPVQHKDFGGVVAAVRRS